MKRLSIVAVAAVVATAALARPRAAPAHLPVEKVVERKDVLQQDCPLEEQDRFKHLEHYIAEALHSWEPFSTLQESVAHDIVRIALDPGEPALFDDDPERARTATLLASVESHEGHGFSYVDRGICNDPTQKDNPVLKNGSCDGGAAHSLWQIHPGAGIVLLDNGSYAYKRQLPADRQGPTEGGASSVALCRTSEQHRGCVIDADALRDRELAVRTAMHMLRASLKRDGTLCEYSGEVKPCPKAVKRLKKAIEYTASHPYP